MHAKVYFLTVMITLVAWSALGSQRPTPTQVLSTPAKTVVDPSPASQWGALVAAAKKEGKLTLYTTQRPEARDALTKAMKENFGIVLETVTGRPPEVVNKLKRERQAGLYLADVGLLGGTTITNELAPMGILMSLDSIITLPEAKDPSKWVGAKLPYLDEKHSALKLVTYSAPSYARNTEMVKPDDLNNIYDLLSPRWKGKIAMSDPSFAGSGNSWFVFTVIEVLGMDKGLKFMKDLLKQEPVMTRDDRLLDEWIAKGKYAIGIGVEPSTVVNLINMKAPIDFLRIRPQYLTAGSGIVQMFKDAPHPNAAKLFINWIASKEGGAIFAPVSRFPSLRSDVSTVSFLPAMIPQPGDIDPTEKYPDYEKRKGELRAVARQIFGSLLK